MATYSLPRQFRSSPLPRVFLKPLFLQVRIRLWIGHFLVKTELGCDELQEEIIDHLPELVAHGRFRVVGVLHRLKFSVGIHFGLERGDIHFVFVGGIQALGFV